MYTKSSQLSSKKTNKICSVCLRKRDVKFFSSSKARICGDCKVKKLREEKKKKPTNMIKKCDILFSKIIRNRDKRCLYCGKTENLQCAHIFSRRHLNTRWDTQNAVTLCIKDHIYGIAHKEPYLFAKWLRDRFGQEYLDELEEKARSTKPVDYEEIYKHLKTYDTTK